MEAVDKFFEKYGDKIVGYTIRVVIAIVVFLIAKKILNMLMKFLTNVLDRTSMDRGVNRFLVSLVHAVGYAVIVLAIATDVLEFKVSAITASVTAIIASAGLTIGLAFQGSLQNFAGGVLILLLRPFTIGDYIIAQGYEGTVETIDIFYTKLLTIDNRMVVLPNGALSNTNITNVTREDVRRLDLTVGIEYSENVGRVREVLLRIIHSKELILADREVNVYVDAFLDSSVSMGIRVWCKTEDYWTLRWDMLESIKNEFDAEGIVIPFNQVDVNLKEMIQKKASKEMNSL